MGDAQEIQLHIRGNLGQEAEVRLQSSSKKDQTATTPTTKPVNAPRRWKWWLLVLLNIFILLAGQTVATLLGRLYFNEGGNSKWMGTIVQSAGFPILIIPLLLYRSPKTSPFVLHHFIKIAAIYSSLGLLIAADNLMYTYGLVYLPVSTYSLICATQLAFNAVFSYFLNSQRFTALIFNSVVLLTFSAALVGVNSGSDTSSGVPEGKYPVGFVLTVGASATFSLILSIMQLTFDKVLKNHSYPLVLQMQFYSTVVATLVSVAGLFISGEWSSIPGEMESYQKGKVAYVMTLAWTAVCWQLSILGMLGLVATVSSLFTNVISTLALPLIPVFAVVFFGDKMDGVKVIALLIAVWGFLSYFYQHYIDDSKSSKISSSKEEKERLSVP